MYKSILGLILSGLLFSCNASYQHLAKADVEYIRTTKNISSNTEIHDMVAPYKTEMEAQMNEALGMLPEDLKKDRPNSNMGNWFCDALQSMAEKHYGPEVDFSLQNYGGLRLPFLGKGELIKSQIYELMPFDNKLVVLKLDGNNTQKLLNAIAEDRGWPMSRGVEFKAQHEKAVDIKIKGAEFDINKVYYVAMPDYVANGGGGCDFLKEFEQFDTGLFIRDAVIEYLQDLKKSNTPITVDNSTRIF